MRPEVIDAIRYGHLLCVAIGLGAAAMADLQVAQRLNRPVTRLLLTRLGCYHRMVWIGLLGMWATGLALIYIRTGFDLAQFTPKLYSKLGVVGILTFNALLIGWVAMPMMRKSYGQAPMSLPLGRKLAGGWVASLSTASWLMALALGESKVLAASGWDVFQVIVPAGYAAAIVGSTFVVLALHLRRTEKWEAPVNAKSPWLAEGMA